METSTLPNTELLATSFVKTFFQNDTLDNVEVISRSPFKGSSTFPAEIIKCKLPDGNILTYSGNTSQGWDLIIMVIGAEWNIK